MTFEVSASEIFTGEVFGHDFTQGDSSYFFCCDVSCGDALDKNFTEVNQNLPQRQDTDNHLLEMPFTDNQRANVDRSC